MDYQYQPLNKFEKVIRVLFRCHGHSISRKEPLQCKVKHFSLLDTPPPRYAAISYSWGSSKSVERILLDGRSIEISASAAGVLRFAFNAEDESMPVWVDAVCINQFDKEEVGHQVGMMRDVYTKADHVLVWLGESDGETEAALQSINDIVTQCRQSTKDLRTLDETLWGGVGAARWYLYSDEALPDSCNWSALRAFFAAHWFTRLWPVQEVCLAKVAKCFRGKHSIQWNDIALAARWLYHRKYWKAVGSRLRGIDCAAEVFDNMRGVNGLYELLQICMYFDATDPRDKVYGLLGMIPPTSAQGQKILLEPDYKDASLKDVYAAAARCAISEGSLTVLKRATWMRPPLSWKPYNNLEIGDFPSWVPRLDWAWDPSQGSSSSINAFTGVSNGTRPLVAEEIGRPDILRIRGLPAQAVDIVCGSLTFDILQIRGELAKAIKNAWGVIRRHTGGRTTSELLMVFAATICAGQDANQGRIDHDQAFKAAFARFMLDHAGIHKADDPVLAECILESQDATSDEFTDAAFENSMNRCIFLSNEGRLGLGPLESQPGDLISVLFGSDVPMILRKHGPYWRCIGDAYVEGLMDVSLPDSSWKK
ncbi:ankyrin repeat and sam domain containing protein 6 [Diplodia corticola]|uniref:Ankyrin repeat and sam domain containing protein 6 n=1 Tax=Diplodia corticola TaxID=236234 RepID=A0A1J9RME3_9PEZI|nr:ankyrin repeat and sam domain containing protein 6 [Diplodia corticola]OJD29679.1 ankyrin repeat and sam domain containing protein 6 [Diplodia corticola]